MKTALISYFTNHKLKEKIHKKKNCQLRVLVVQLLACVASVSNRVIARKLERKQKKGPSFPSPSPVINFFCSCPSFLDEPREETLATQAMQLLHLAGHCLRQPNKIASKLVLWQSSVGRVSRGRQPIDSYIGNIKRDTSLHSISEIRSAMLDRNVWKDFVMKARSRDRPK